MATIAKANVQLGLDFAKFSQGMTQATKVLNSNVANMKRSLGSLNSFATTTKNLLTGVALGFVGTQVVGGVQKLIHAFGEAEKSAVALRSALEVTGRGGSQVFNSLVENADRLQRSTTAENDALIKATATFAQFANKLSGAELQKGQQLIVALSKGLGVDLDKAAIQAGKAVSGLSDAVGRTGIKIEGAKSQTDRLNQAVEKTSGFFAQAQAEAQTTQGRFEILKNTSGDLNETWGEIIATGLGLNQRFDELTEGALEANKALKENQDVLVGTISVFTKLTVAAIQMAVAVGGAIVGTVADVTSGIISMVSAAVSGLNALPGINISTKGLNNTSKSLGKFANSTFDVAGGSFGAKGMFKNLGGLFKAPSRSNFNFMKGSAVDLGGGGGGSKKGGKSEAEKEMDRLKALMEKAKPETQKLREEIAFLNRMFDAGKVHLVQYNQAMAELNKEMGDKILGPGVEDAIKKKSEDLFKPFNDFLKEMEGSVKPTAEFEFHFGNIRSIIESMETPADKFIQQLNEIQAAYNAGIFGAVGSQEAINNALKLKDTLSTVFAEAQNEKDKMADGFKDLEMAIQGWGRQAEDAFIDAFATGKFAFKDMVSSILKDMARLILNQTVTKPLVGGISSFIGGLFGGGKAEGGPVSGGTSYLVGERGPELFMPRSSGTIVPNHEMGGGGVTIVQNVSFNTIDAKSFQDRLAEHSRFLSNVSVRAVQQAENRRGRQGPMDAGRAR